MADFITAFDYTLKDEGGFVNDKHDKGGATKYGISKYLMMLVKKRRGQDQEVSDDDIKMLTIDDAKSIYKEFFWDFMKLDLVKYQSVATAMFNACVNIGYTDAAKYAQRACGAIDDGVIGMKTIEAINSTMPKDFMLRFTSEMVLHYHKIVDKDSTQGRFLVGWLNRVKRYNNLV